MVSHRLCVSSLNPLNPVNEENSMDKYKLEKYWDIHLADYEYQLYVYTAGEWKLEAEGDKYWAWRTCEHYGLKMIE